MEFNKRKDRNMAQNENSCLQKVADMKIITHEFVINPYKTIYRKLVLVGLFYFKKTHFLLLSGEIIYI